MMSVYMVIEIQVHNSALYTEYVEKVPAILDQYGGRYLVRGGAITPLSGTWHPERIVIIEFETIDQLRACFRSDAYRAIAPLREQSTTSKTIVVEGVLNA
jgi:uncharacterized protein (DUF1330 family)